MLRARLLGQFQVWLDDQPVEIASRPAQTLLAYLLLHPGLAHRRDQLAGRLWPDSLEASARKNLRNAVWQVRRAVGDPYLRAEKETVAFETGAGWQLDVRTLADTPPEADVEALAAAAAAYQGELLPGFYEDWVLLERDRLRGLFDRCMQALLERLRALRRWTEAQTWAERWIAQGHAPEPAFRALMLARAAQGDLAGMAAAYRRCVQALKSELDVAPSPETQRLYEQLSRGELPSQAAPSATPPPGERYERGALLARGGQGEVYHGRDRVTGQAVVIKLLRPDLAARHPEALARFMREGEALGRLNHPNIVRWLAAYEHAGQHHIVMEYAPGGTLRDLLAGPERLPVRRVVELALELADALARAHHLDIIHRDLKPENVLLAADGTPRLTDFGLAALADDPGRLTQPGAVVGSPLYMSPEAVRGLPLDARSDIWSFGALLYELLAGQPPFAGGHLAAVFERVLRDPPPDLALARPDTPAPPLADLIRRALDKDPAQRPASMRQVAAELEAIRDGRTVETQPPAPSSAPSPTPPPTREQHIRFCTSTDGVRIAYAALGSGPPLIKAANWLSHLEHDWRSPVWRHWLQGLSDHYRFIRYDERACGLSDWNVDDLSFEAWVRDLEAVVEASGEERFALLGISQGGPISIAYAVRHPERVSHLILCNTYARGGLSRNLPPEKVREREMMQELMAVGWGQENPVFRQVFTSLFIPGGTPEQHHWFNELQRVSASPENAKRMAAEFLRIDVRDLAPRVQAPTLVLHTRGDLRVPLEEGRLLAALIPGARLVPLEGLNHILLESEPSWPRFLDELTAFYPPRP